MNSTTPNLSEGTISALDVAEHPAGIGGPASRPPTLDFLNVDGALRLLALIGEDAALQQGAAVDLILGRLVTAAESAFPGVVCAVCLTDSTDHTLEVHAPAASAEIADILRSMPMRTTRSFLTTSGAAESDEAELLDAVHADGFASLWTVPLAPTNGDVLGNLLVLSPADLDPGAGAWQTLEAIASLSTIAIESQRRLGVQRLRNEIVALLAVVATAANLATTGAEALQATLDAVCAICRWPVGHAYTVNADGEPQPGTLWHLTDGTHVADAEAAARDGASNGVSDDQSAGERHDSLTHRVIASRLPEWEPDVALFPAALRSTAMQLQENLGAVSVPILVGDEVVAIMEFLTHGAVNHDGQMLAALGQVGMQLGRAIERERNIAQLEGLNVKLLRSNRDLEEYASVASHDLQEPLRKIQAFGDRLERRSGESLDEPGRQYLARMLDASNRMHDLINDLLQYSRATTREQLPTDLDLSDIAQAVINDLEPVIDECGAQIHLGNLPTLEADPTQMRQLLQNLIGNALKFRVPDVSPIVRIDAVAPERTLARGLGTEHNEWAITVSDNGIGFDTKYEERIFKVFERLHGRGVYNGAGVGLAICRKIVERHHGTISATSTPGEGSTFTITLPERQPPEGLPR